ncbi:DUF523 domain-containing protein [Desulfocurvus vexinensis]|uniref:DUF523 domain-containing protein n=1 Tax=Desulfocurvus vexinensis TaxID=399548 RepID=UPI0004B84CB7|nr:DUF523 domain-containing protein [Desulfocurvus vexinensis]
MNDSSGARPVRYVVSACLAGIHSRYNGERKAVNAVLDLIRQGVALPVCPEQLGGLPTPRPPCEIVPGAPGCPARVVNRLGVDQSAEFHCGAQEALRLAQLFGATRAVLKAGSPSCGSGQVYDGTFSGRRVPGDGVLAAVLKAAGIEVLDENDLARELGAGPP